VELALHTLKQVRFNNRGSRSRYYLIAVVCNSSAAIAVTVDKQDALWLDASGRCQKHLATISLSAELLPMCRPRQPSPGMVRAFIDTLISSAHGLASLEGAAMRHKRKLSDTVKYENMLVLLRSSGRCGTFSRSFKAL
jgi:hypothetical protein